MSSVAPRGGNRLPWVIFAALLVIAMLYIAGTAAGLPDLVASHFNAAGDPNSYMPRARYVRFMLGMAVGLPLVMVVLLTAVYSNAPTLKLPNRDYWLAPERIGQARAMLRAHGVWFGCLLVIMVCFVHWLELGANRNHPAHLSSGLVQAGMLAFLIAIGLWIVALMVAFRRKRN